MELQADNTAALLNQSYIFQSVSGKNANFMDSIHEQPFFFRSASAPLPEFLRLHAGGEITYTVPLKFRQSPLPYAILLLISDGEGVLTFDAKENVTLAKNDMLLLSPHLACQFATSHTPFSYSVFYLSGAVSAAYLPMLVCDSGYYKKSLTAGDDLLLALFPALSKQISRTEDSSSLHISTLLHLLFSLLLREQEQKNAAPSLPAHVAQMKELFDSDFKTSHSLEELEALIGISRYRLCRDFSKYVGISPVQYVNQIRITRARYMLLHTDLPVHEIGSAVGIDNTTHFINLFKRNAGITPLQFRQTHT